MRWPWRKKSDADPRHAQGLWGEKQAARFLEGKRYRILGKRVRIGRRDELDLVARDGNCLVFVEVKTRASEDFARPAESIDRAKRHALSRAAMGYLRRVKQKPDYFRFDVVEVIGSEGQKAPVIRHIENAFPLEGGLRVPW